MQDEQYQKLLSTGFTSFDAQTTLQNAMARLEEQNDLPEYIVFSDPATQVNYLEDTDTFIQRYNKWIKSGKPATVQLGKLITKPAITIGLTTIIKDIAVKAVISHNNNIIGVFNGAPDFRGLINKSLADLIPDKVFSAITGPRDAELPIQRPASAGNPKTGTPPQADNSKAGADDDPNESNGGYFLNVSHRKTLSIDDYLTIVVSIDTTAGEDEAALPLPLTGNPLVEVIISPKENLQLHGKQAQSIQLPDEVGEKRLFRLDPTKTGNGRFLIYAFVDGVELAHIELAVTITAEAEAAQDTTPASVPIVPDHTTKPADLNLLITESKIEGQTALHFMLTAADEKLNCYFRPYGPVTLKLAPSTYFRSFYNDIESLSLKTEEQQQIAVKKMEAKGSQLYTALLPDDLRSYIWKIGGNIRTVMISSEEPWIPWEVCMMQPGEEDDNTNAEPGFFCERFTMARWIPGKKSPRNKLKLSKAALIIPESSGLPFAAQERDQLTALFKSKGLSVDLIPAKYIQVLDALGSGSYSIIHFTGHGAFSDTDNPDTARIRLDNNQSFSPEDIYGNALRLGAASPLVFFNACQVGQFSMGLTGMGGWAEKFLSAGAGAFIGTNWSVFDYFACALSLNFYTNLLAAEQMPVAKALQEARLSVAKKGNPTWLAYTLFADPNAYAALPG